MSTRNSRSESGAVAVEAALVVPLLVLMLLGIVEMSLMMRDTVAVSSAVRVGARIGSVSAGAGPDVCDVGGPTGCVGLNPNAPGFAAAAANAIQRAGSAMPKDQIDSLMVYQANKQGYPMPTGNENLTCSSNCVVYVWDKALNKFRYQSGSWSSASVNACVNDPALDALGVAMMATHPFMTGLFGKSITLQERSVMQFEPLDQEHCKPNKHP